MAELKQVSAQTFDQERLAEDELPVVLEFYTPICGFCRRFKPILESLAEKYEGRVKILQVNALENRELAAEHDVHGVPTTIIFKRGKPVDRVTGLISEAEAAKRIDAVLD